MATVFYPPMKPVPPGATKEDRARMFKEYKAEMIRANPGRFNSDGTLKSWWGLIKGLFA